MTGKRNCPYCNVKLGTTKRPYSHMGVYLGHFEFDSCVVCRRFFQPKEVAIAIEQAARSKGVWGIGPEIIVQPDASNATSVTVTRLRRTAELALGSNVINRPVKSGNKTKTKASNAGAAEIFRTPRAVVMNA